MPPISFPEELVSWAGSAPDEIFLKTDRRDVCSLVADVLGTAEQMVQRKAIMMEVLRVLPGSRVLGIGTKGAM
jgi:hypothetical protein